MFIDAENLYSDDQAITATAVSTNVIDHTVAGLGPGEPVEILVQVTEAFDAGTLQVVLQTDSDEAFGTAVNLVTTNAVTTAAVGYQFALSTLPQHIDVYTRLNFVVTGTPTTGTVKAGLIKDRQTNG